VLIIPICLLFSVPILAQEETIELEAAYPEVEDTPPAVFKFPISLIYLGGQTRDFDLQIIGPFAWDTYVTSGDESIRISVIKLRPNVEYSNHIMVIAAAPPSAMVGNHKITLIVSSGVIRDSIEFTAVITPRYSLKISPSPVSHHVITANKDNHLSVTIENTGSDTLTNIRFLVNEPEGWTITLIPDSINSLSPGISRDVQIAIKPSKKVNNRFYKITLTAKAAQTTQETVADLYFDVEEPQGPWMWIGGIIVLVAISIFTYIFIKMDRKKEVA
jgi:uncharacterized membrane protein